MTTPGFRFLADGRRRRLGDGRVRSVGGPISRYADVVGAVGMGMGASGRGSALVPLVGETRLMFGLSGDLEQSGMLGRTALSIGVSGALSAAVVLQGATALSFGMAGHLARSAPLAGTTAVSVRIVGDIAIAQPLRGTVRLSFGAVGRLTPRRILRGHARLGFGLTGNLTVPTGGRWRDLWREVYDKRQALLNAIDEANRNLAKDAGDAANAAAQAVVVTNTRIDTVDGRVTAEANRTTALTTRVTNAENTTAAQGTAISNLQTTSTAQGNTLTSHSQQLVNVNASITGLDGRVTNVANATTLLSAEVDSLGGAKAIHGVYLDVNGYISGTQSINDGVSSQFNVLADVFRLLSPGAASGMEVQDGYLRVWRAATQVIIGNGFGASGNLLFYAGPNVGVGNASTLNSIFHIDDTGEGYFGGQLRAGTLTSAQRWNFIDAWLGSTSQMVLQHAGSNGRPKAVSFGGNIGHYAQYNGNVGGSYPTRTATMRRRVYRGATLLATHTATASSTTEFWPYVAGDPWPPIGGGTVVNQSWAFPTVTLDDTFTGTGDVVYSIVIDKVSGDHYQVVASQISLAVVEQ